jgi:alpha-galactosidase
MAEATRWVAAKLTQGAVLPEKGDSAMDDGRRKPPGTDPPFSFTYGGKPSIELLKAWPCQRASRRLDAVRTERTAIWNDPATGLVVRCVAIEYHDFPTVEWTVFLKNGGAVDSAIVADLESLDAVFERGAEGEFVLHHARGDDCSPASYEPLVTPLAPNSEHRFAPTGGRPTTGAFPYFNLAWPREGVILAIGWPGQWAARFRRDAGVGIRVTAGQERTRFKLLPGEEVRTPLVVVQFWKGDRLRAQNLWRRWMLAHNLPRVEGRLPPPILSSCSGGFFPGLKCNEADERRFLDTFAREKIPLDYWWMDAGWYPCGDGWPKVGTWEPDPERFPRGLRAVSDHAHALGMKLIVWFEPERVAPGTWLAEKHPEWIFGGRSGGLLNLGNPEARAWLTDHVAGLLASQGIDLYRQDFNIDPLGFWRAADAPDRQGIAEIRHIEGYLAYWDELRRRRPGLLIDSCASGGRRNDLETLRRAVPLLRSDYQSFAGDPAFAPGNQCHTYGLASWIPYFGQGTYYQEKHLVYNVRSHYCPAFGLCYDVRKPGVDWNRFRRLVEDWRKIAPSLLGDFYPLTPYRLDDSVWIAWQFDRPESGEGAIQAFRRAGSTEETARLRLGGLDPHAKYAVTDLDSGAVTQTSGKELLETGLKITLADRPGSAILTYRRLGPEPGPAR